MARYYPNWLHAHVLAKWKETRFYDRLSDYDLYYIERAKGLYLVLQPSPILKMIAPKANERDIADLGVWIMAWFEDFINEVGLWKAFVDRHQEVAGRYLPFLDLEDYDPDYINWQDLSIIVWAWARSVTPGKFTDPTHEFLRVQAVGLMPLLEAFIDQAPATELWDDFLQVDDEDGFAEIRAKLMWLALDSYLYGQLDLALKYAAMQSVVFQKSADKDAQTLYRLGYDLQLSTLFNQPTKWGGELFPAVAARILRGSPEMLASIAACSAKVTDDFWLEKTDADYHYLRHKDTGRVLQVVAASADLNPGSGRLIKASLVKWCGQFWINGMAAQRVMPEPKTKQEANLPLEFGTAEEVASVQAMIDEQYALFVSLFGGPLKQCLNAQAAEQAVLEFYTQLERQTAARLGIESEPIEGPKLQGGDPTEPIALFFVERRGMLTSGDLGYLIDYFGREPCDESEIRAVFMTLFKDLPLAVVEHVVAHYEVERLRYPGLLDDFAANVHGLCWFMNPDEATGVTSNQAILVLQD